MAISSPGIGSNIDVNSLVTQLMALERRPLDALNQQRTFYNNELSAYGTLSSDLSAFQTAVSALKNTSSFSVFTATAADATLLTASADSTASAGSHSITVTQLAQSQKLFSAGFADTTITAVGTGTLTFSNGASSFSVAIDATNNTLSGITNAVNSAASNFGVSASIVNDGTGNRLLFAPNSTGSANAITVSVVDGDGTNLDNLGLSRLSYTAGGLNLTQTQAAQNAIITVDGLSGISKASNTISDVIQGVTLNLLKGGGASTTLNVAVDSTTITANVNSVVTAYNKLISDINNLHKKGGTLEADNTVISIQSQLLGVFNTPAAISGNAYNYLAQVGLSLQSNGTLALDSSAFQSALSSHLTDVTKLFTDSTQGFMQRFYTQTMQLLQPNGLVDSQNQGINAQISDVGVRIDQMQTRLTLTEARLRAQYSALDAMLGSLSQTTNLLSKL
ncbi:MAG: flagellar filament capping protein FliD [Burkholderiales bacterium]